MSKKCRSDIGLLLNRWGGQQGRKKNKTVFFLEKRLFQKLFRTPLGPTKHVFEEEKMGKFEILETI